MYRGIISKGKRGAKFMTADQCYGCNKFLADKNKLKNHLESCGSMPGLVYKFENQNISTFEDNIKFMGDLPVSIYFDLETTCGKKIYEFEEVAEMYPISYAFVVAFNPCLNLERIFTVLSNSSYFRTAE